MLKLNIVKEVHSEPFVVFASLPDMGRVGGLTSTFLASQFDAQLVASITSVEKPWVSVKDGLVANVIDTYNIYYSDTQKLVIFSGNNQPEDPRELFGLCTTFLDYCMSIGRITRLYTAGGSFNEQLTEEPRVVAVATTTTLRELLLKFKINVIGNEISTITWFNGLILGMAAERNIEAIGFYGEISNKSIPQPLAAKSIVKVFGRIEGMNIDIKPFDRQYEEVLDNLEKRKGINESRPGIG